MPIFKSSKSIAKDSIYARSSDSSTLMSMVTGSDQVRVVTEKDYKAAGACLSNAFSKDEVAGYFFNCQDTVDWSEERKWALHCQLMEAITFAHVKFGVVHAIGDPTNEGSFDAVALWMPPGANMDSYFAMFKCGLLWKVLKGYRSMSKEGRIRMFKEFFPLLSSTKAEVLKERDPSSWYLVYLGTHARARGRGSAKKLIAEVSKQADPAGEAIYLESSNIINVAIYRKMGFEVCKRITLHRGEKEISLDVMVREPKDLEAVDPVAINTIMSHSLPITA